MAAAGATSPIGSVTIIAPMLNEAAHIEQFVTDVAAQDYGGPVEVIVADGGSSDGSAELLEAAAARAGLRLVLVANPDRYVSQGLNRCLERASGDLIVRLDCHSRYPADYVRLCVEASEETGAWNVGGVAEPRGRTAMERAVAAAMDSPFGGIGWTRAALDGARVETDHVTYGAFRAEALARIGQFDEGLIRNQDDEIDLRLRLAGGTVVLDPRIRVFYVPRGTLRGVFRQYWEYGRWKIPVMRKHRRALGARSLVPAAFVASVAVLAVAAPWLRPALWLLVAEVGLYLAAALLFGARALRLRGEPLTLLPRVVGAFLAFHVGYGAGMLRALLPR
jgi:glycosyltransferase involved in cell wall biosynthesis